MPNIINLSTGSKQQDNEFLCRSSINLSSNNIDLEELEKLRELDKLRELITDFYSIFPYIRQYIRESFFNDISKTNYTKKPLVNVKDITDNIGLKIFEFPFSDIYDTFKKLNIDIHSIPNILIIPKHALLSYKDKIILINKNDSIEEKYFSIAHEIFHYIFLKNHNENMSIIANKKSIWTEQLKMKFNNNELNKGNNQINDDSLASRFGLAARDNKETRKGIRAILRNIPLEQDELITLISNALKMDISDMVEDEIADYFAANLLVPVDRFILWDDKPDEEIAKAFKTVIKCITKRRIEIKNELEIMKPKNLSSGIELKKIAPILHDNLNHSLGGNSVHDTEKI